jgi:hypothetical protein
MLTARNPDRKDENVQKGDEGEHGNGPVPHPLQPAREHRHPAGSECDGENERGGASPTPKKTSQSYREPVVWARFAKVGVSLPDVPARCSSSMSRSPTGAARTAPATDTVRARTVAATATAASASVLPAGPENGH